MCFLSEEMRWDPNPCRSRASVPLLPAPLSSSVHPHSPLSAILEKTTPTLRAMPSAPPRAPSEGRVPSGPGHDPAANSCEGGALVSCHFFSSGVRFRSHYRSASSAPLSQSS